MSHIKILLRKEVSMEGHLVMNKKERERLVVMARVRGKGLTIKEASEVLLISYRQTKRIYSRYRKDGAKGLIHKSRGRRSNRAIEAGMKEEILESYRVRYNGFGAVFSAEKLTEQGYKIDHETLRQWLIKEGLWQKRRTRNKYRKWRERRHHFGELVQLDGSHHGWFGEKSGEICLLNMIDDATGTTFALFDREETIKIAMRTLWGWIKRYGIPKALYVDYKNVYVSDKEPTIEERLRGEGPMTHFGKACKKLGIQIIPAGSPQAKGRIERSHGVHQDRLVKELQLRNIRDIERANKFVIDKYLPVINRKFAVQPASPTDYHRAIPEGLDLRTVFCIEEERRVNNDWTLQYKNRYLQILKDNKIQVRRGEKVTISQWLDDSIHLLCRGEGLKYKELPSRPIKEAIQQVKTMRPGKKYIPPENHPWRSFSLCEKTNAVYRTGAMIPP
jgi:transposase